MDVVVEVHCSVCGSANYSLPDGARESGAVRCNDCGRDMGRVEDLQAEMLACVLAQSAEVLRREIGRLPSETGEGA